MDNPNPPSPASRKVARHGIRQKIQQMILSGKFRPGVKLNQLHLSRKLNVSMGLVREALLELKNTGLVETIDNRGMFVSEMSLQKIRDIYELRAIHEGLAARKCCGKITSDQLAELRQLAAHCHDLALADSGKDSAAADRNIHVRMVEISGNKMLMKLYENHQVLGKFLWLGSDPETTFQSHQAVLDAVEANRPDDAERLMRDHISRGAEAAEKYISEEGLISHWLL